MENLRVFIAELESQNDLLRITKEVNRDFQAAAICAMSNRADGPAALFENIQGYPGVKMAGNLYSGLGQAFIKPRKPWSRIATGLELDPLIPYEELMEVLIERKKAPIKAFEVDNSPCREEIHLGKDVNLNEFPIPWVHQGDAGRYLTSQIVIVKDPDTGWVNWGVYRLQMKDTASLVNGTIPRLRQMRHIKKIFQKYESQNRPMPFAIAIGTAPSVFFTAAMNLPEGADESEIAGGLLMNPIELIKCETNELLVPAMSEIILEGEIQPGQRVEEGPFGGFTKYSDPAEEFIYKINAITHRKNPILPFVTEGAGSGDALTILSIFHSLELLEAARTSVFPVRWISLPVEAKMGLCVVSTKTSLHAGFPHRVSRFLFSRSNWFEKVLVLDTDVDPEDMATILNDMIQKAHPKRDIHLNGTDAPLGLVSNYPCPGNITSQLYIDATWRVDRPKESIPKRISFEHSYPEDVKQRIIDKWNKEYGFETELAVYKLKS